MRNLILLFALGMVFQSCNQEEAEGLVSKWQLIEQLADPGDGSGTFQPIQSDKTISFYEDGTFASNASVCFMETEIGDGSTGTYDEANSILNVDDCNMGVSPVAYEMVGANLIINYPCIEPCREKYERID